MHKSVFHPEVLVIAAPAGPLGAGRGGGAGVAHR